MADKDFDIKIDGLEDIQKMLKELPQDVGERIQKDINMKASKIIVEEMQRIAPDGNNSKKSKSKIEDNIIAKKGKNSDPTSIWVGIKKKVFYALFLSQGTAQRSTKGKGKYKKEANRGAIKANDWVQKAHDAAAPQAVKFLQDNYVKLINQSVKKQLRRLIK